MTTRNYLRLAALSCQLVSVLLVPLAFHVGTFPTVQHLRGGVIDNSGSSVCGILCGDLAMVTTNRPGLALLAFALLMVSLGLRFTDEVLSIQEARA